MQSACVFLCYCGAKSLALISHLATWYLNFTLRTDVSIRLFFVRSIVLNLQLAARTDTAPPFFARSTVAAYKTAVRLFNQSEQIPFRDCFKAGAAALFLKFLNFRSRVATAGLRFKTARVLARSLLLVVVISCIVRPTYPPLQTYAAHSLGICNAAHDSRS